MRKLNIEEDVVIPAEKWSLEHVAFVIDALTKHFGFVLVRPVFGQDRKLELVKDEK